MDWDGTIVTFNEMKFLRSFNQALLECNYPKSMQMTTLYESKSIISSLESRIKSPQKTQEAYNKFKEIFASQAISEEELMKCARTLIIRVRSARIPIGVISNLDQTLLEKQIETLRLTSSFNIIIGSARKPDTSALIKAAHSLHITPSKAIWFLGDSLQTDILAANKAGFTSILVNQSKSTLVQSDLDQIKADIQLSNLNEAIQILNTLTQPGRSI
jgi:HAD superfamily hydrolase (TIGR01549 family)